MMTPCSLSSDHMDPPPKEREQGPCLLAPPSHEVFWWQRLLQHQNSFLLDISWSQFTNYLKAQRGTKQSVWHLCHITGFRIRHNQYHF